MYYSSFGALSIIILLIINFDIIWHSEASPIRVKYRNFLFSIILYLISDMLWGILYESKLVIFAYSDTVLYFFSMVLSVLMWTRFVVEYLDTKRGFGSMLNITGWIIFVYEIITLGINFFTPIVFSFDSSGKYYPQHARYITLAVQTLLFFISSVYTLNSAHVTEGKSKLHHTTVALSGLAMTLFIILQTIYPLLPFYAIGCLIGTCLIHTFIVVDEKADYYRELGNAKFMAYTDPLTGVKNNHAYINAKKKIDERIREGTLKDFAVVIFDINNLKLINDTMGHGEGDKYIKIACNSICSHFKHSPIYRIGGDEFVAFLEGEDYLNRIIILSMFDREAEKNLRSDRPVIATGIEEYHSDKDRDFNTIFERADYSMYKRKKQLKEM